MDVNFPASLAETFHQEGGYSNNKADPGGKTKYGITESEWQAWQKSQPAHAVPIRGIGTITRDEAAQIYKVNYWNASGCNALASGFDLTVFDCAVNNGVHRAHGWLASLQSGKSTNLSTRERIVAFNQLRYKFDRGLSIWRVFGGGWSRRIKEIQARSLSLVTDTVAEKESAWFRVIRDANMIWYYILTGKLQAT